MDLRKILESISILNEYKITSHFCLGEFLKIKVKKFNFYEFDRLRYIRNGINYYGNKIEFNQGKEIIKKIFDFKRDSLKIIKI